MATVKEKYIIELDYFEATALKTILGNLSDIDYEDMKIGKNAMEGLKSVWCDLPWEGE